MCFPIGWYKNAFLLLRIERVHCATLKLCLMLTKAYFFVSITFLQLLTYLLLRNAIGNNIDGSFFFSLFFESKFSLKFTSCCVNFIYFFSLLLTVRVCMREYIKKKVRNDNENIYMASFLKKRRPLSRAALSFCRVCVCVFVWRKLSLHYITISFFLCVFLHLLLLLFVRGKRNLSAPSHAYYGVVNRS